MSVLSYALNKIGVGPNAAPAEELREFVTASSIPALLAERHKDKKFDNAQMLLIFKTKVQHTWLVATADALYCVIDNRKQDRARNLWHIPRAEIEKEGRIVLQINEAVLTNRDAYLIVNGKRPRKITKNLFETLSIKDTVEDILRNAFRL